MRNLLLKFSSVFGRANRAPPRIGVFCHVFFPELAGEILAHVANIPGPVDLLVSTDTRAKADAISSAFGRWNRGAVQIEVLPNLGRDIAPRLTFYRHHHRRYDLVLFLHSKRGQLVVDGDEWRRYLYRNLAGSPASVRRIVAAFQQDRRLGLMFPPHWPQVAPFISWGGNVERATALALRLGLPALPGGPPEFPSGSMFWARPAALEPLLALGLTLDDFEPELGQADATLAHAIERMFLISCERAGLRWRTLDVSPADEALQARS